MHASKLISLGGLLAALAVALGAMGASALKAHLTPEQLETYHTAVHYQMLHALGLVIIGLVALHRPSRWFDLAAWAMMIGIVLFSGFIMAWLATGQKWFVYPVPVGGVAFIAGWLMLAIGAVGLGRGIQRQ